MKRPITFCIAASALVFVSACQQTETADSDADTAGSDSAPEWGYTAENGPEKWGSLSEANAACDTGKEQSPIDLPAAGDANTMQVSGNYGAASAKIVDKGYTVQADFGEGFTLTSGDNTYNLVQFHMHTPSENTVDGKAFPMTAHLVHASDAGDFAVLGIMFEEGDANAQLQAMIDNIGGDAEIDVAGLLPSDMTVYNFPGSLTTPPCTEGVNWHVLTTPVSASAEQIAALSEKMGNNARPVQPLNERKLTKD